MNNEKKKSRKGKYAEWIKEEKLALISGWCRNGLSYEQIAHNIGISRQTLFEWQHKYPEIREALRIGREVADIMVENALFKRALGFSYEEKKETITEKGFENVTFSKVVPGDTNAQMFWLKRRKPDIWDDKKDDQIETNEKERSVLEMPETRFVPEPEVVDE